MASEDSAVALAQIASHDALLSTGIQTGPDEAMGIREQIRQGNDRVVLEQFAAAADRPGTTLAHLDANNPTRRRCEVQLIVVDGPSARGRVAAIVNPRLADGNSNDGAPVGLLGFFESDRNPDTARWLLDYGCEWLAKQGCGIVRGPINFTTWHDYRLTSKVYRTRDCNFGSLRIAGEPTNPAYYPALWLDSEFRVAADYATSWLLDLRSLREKFAPAVRRATDSGCRLRPIGPADLSLLYRLAMECFADAYMFSPIEPDEFAALYTPNQAAAATTQTKLALDADGEPLGFIYTIDAHTDSLSRIATTATDAGARIGVVKTIAVSPKHRGRGIYKMLLSDFFDSELDSGATRAIGALMHASGSPAKMGWISPETNIKEYQLYERSL